MKTLEFGLSLAASAALVAVGFAATPAAAQDDGGSVVKCFGINSCKGTSDCKTAKNDCKGQNACKGQGFKAISLKACQAAGGSVDGPK